MMTKKLLVLCKILTVTLSGIFILSILVVGLILGAVFKSRNYFGGSFRNSPQSIEMEWRHVATDENEVEDDLV